MPSSEYGIVGIFVLASFGAAMVAALLVDTTTVSEFVVNYAIRVLVTVLLISGVAVLIAKHR